MASAQRHAPPYNHRHRASSGVGLYTVGVFVHRSWPVVMTYPDIPNVSTAVECLSLPPDQRILMHADLGSQASIRSITNNFQASGLSLGGWLQTFRSSFSGKPTAR